MTSVVHRAPGVASLPDPKTDGRLPGGPPRRRPLLALASAAVVFASVAGFASLYASANHQVAVLVTTQTIEQGQRFSSNELGQTSAAISGGVSVIPVVDASELAGARAAVTIPAGSLLTTADLTDASPVPAGDAEVGLALKAGQLPAEGVAPGDRVMIDQTAAPGAPVGGPGSSTGGGASSSEGSASSVESASGTGVLVPEAVVSSVENPPANSSSETSELVSVEVSSTVAAAVSTAANAGQISLVLLPTDPGGGGQAS